MRRQTDQHRIFELLYGRKISAVELENVDIKIERDKVIVCGSFSINTINTINDRPLYLWNTETCCEERVSDFGLHSCENPFEEVTPETDITFNSEGDFEVLIGVDFADLEMRAMALALERKPGAHPALGAPYGQMSAVEVKTDIKVPPVCICGTPSVERFTGLAGGSGDTFFYCQSCKDEVDDTGIPVSGKPVSMDIDIQVNTESGRLQGFEQPQTLPRHLGLHVDTRFEIWLPQTWRKTLQQLINDYLHYSNSALINFCQNIMGYWSSGNAPHPNDRRKVMEYMLGRALAERILRNPSPVTDSQVIAEVCDYLRLR